jgi:hypothetical protein
MEGLVEFLKIEYGSGSGDGSGYGSGDGSGSGSGYGYGSGSGDGSGSGSGYGYGSGDGSGSGSGYGYGSGSGYGSGDGSGSGSGYGYGDGSGSGDGLKSLNKKPVHYIDGVATIITALKNNVAKGHIVNRDLTSENCFVVKQNNLFAHGKTLKDARDSLFAKLFDDMPEYERIDAFLAEFKPSKKYSAQKFFDWHGKLTGSCLFGREQFAKDRQINLSNDTFTLAEFIDLTKNSYGGEIIKKLEDSLWKL